MRIVERLVRFFRGRRAALAALMALCALAPGCVFVPPSWSSRSSEPPTVTRVRWEPVGARDVAVRFVSFERQVVASRAGNQWIADRRPHAVIAVVRDAASNEAAPAGGGADAPPLLLEASTASLAGDGVAATPRLPGVTCREDAVIVGPVTCRLTDGDLIVVRIDPDGQTSVLGQGFVGDRLERLTLWRTADELVDAVGRAIREGPPRAEPEGSHMR